MLNTIVFQDMAKKHGIFSSHSARLRLWGLGYKCGNPWFFYQKYFASEEFIAHTPLGVCLAEKASLLLEK